MSAIAKAWWLPVVLAVLTGFVGTVEANGRLDDIELFGFADVQYQANPGNARENQFAFGQFQVELAAPVYTGISVEAAVAYDPTTEMFGIGVAYVDFDIFGSHDVHEKHREEGITHDGVIVGQFDIPFGLDWRHYDAPDRRLVSAPMTTDDVLDAWNTVGVQAYTDRPTWNGVLYVVNGQSYPHYDPQAFPPNRNVEMVAAAGGRLGVTPLEAVEVGLSVALQVDAGTRLDMMLAGADLQATLQGVELRAEYIQRQTHMAGGDPYKMDRYYVQAAYDWDGWFAVGRFGSESDGAVKRVTAGLGRVLVEGIEMRAEYSERSVSIGDSDFGSSEAVLQLIAVF